MRVLRIRQVIERINVSKPHLYRLVRDGEFPKQIRIGAGAVGWIEEEVDAWIAERASERTGR